MHGRHAQQRLSCGRPVQSLDGTGANWCGQVKWLLYSLVVIPLYLVGEACCGWFFSEERVRKISSKSFSPDRILFALPFAIAAIAVFWLIRWLIAGDAS